MAILVNNRTQETCAAPGTGTVTLLGAVSGYRTFSAGIGANNLTYYVIADQTGANWEVGIGTIGSGGTTLARTTVLDSSNGGSLTNFSSGTQAVWSDYPANAAVMQTDVGTAPNQVPLNQYLGKLAFMDVLDTVNSNVQQTTNTTNEGPSLLLDFANSKTLDPRITFTRASTATYYNGITSAVAEQNLFAYSQTFGNAAWVSTNNAIATGVTDPASGTTAQTLTASAGNSTFYQTVTLTATAYTVSFYVQRVTGTGTINFTLDGTNFTAITAPTGSWVRYNITATPTAGSRTVGIQIVTSGDAINIAFGQLEQRASATAYNATTTTALTNYIPALQTAPLGVARFDCNPTTGESLGLLIEEQRTNLITQSQFASGWTLQGTDTAILNANIAPDGTQTFAKFIPSTANIYPGHRILQNVTISNGTVYTFSAYIKNAGVRYVQLCLNTGFSIYANFDLTAGVVGTSTATSSSITAVGNGVYRCTITGTSTGTTGECNIISSTSSSAVVFPVYAGDGFSGLYLWGAQLEAGAFPTSYIPTVASQVTRVAEVALITNITPWFNQAQGTLFAQAKFNDTTSSAYNRITTLDDSASANYVSISRLGGALTVYGELKNNGTVTGLGNIVSSSSSVSTAVVYGLSPVFVSNGVAGTNFSSNTPVSLNRLTIGNQVGSVNFLNGYIKKLAYYPIALSSAELQEMTS